MSGLKEIRKQMWHRLNPSYAALAGSTVAGLQQFAGGYIGLPEQALQALTSQIWNGKKRYDAASDTLVDIQSSF